MIILYKKGDFLTFALIFGDFSKNESPFIEKDTLANNHKKEYLH